MQRRAMRGERDLSPVEYIQKQAILESNHPGTSALAPAMHAEFIKQLQRHAFVKAFGFQELLATDDAFSNGSTRRRQICFENFQEKISSPSPKKKSRQ